MNLRSVLIMVLGLGAGLLAAVGVLQSQRSPMVLETEAAPTVQVLVVKTAVQRGHLLTEAHVELRDWPEELIPESAIREVQAAVGRIALSKLYPGEPLLEFKLAAEGATRGAGNLVRPGMRAYSIMATTPASSVAGLVLPGDHVDVVLSMQSNGRDDGSGGGSSTTLLQNVEILAIDQNLEASDNNHSDAKLSSVTLLVSQRQASLLALGQKAGTLTLSLRNPEDAETAETEPVTLAGLRFREERPAAPLEGEDAARPDGAAVAAIAPPAEAGAAVVAAVQDAAVKDASSAESAQPATAEIAVPSKPRLSSIRTLRGTQAGYVSVLLNN
jgi:pilus assembly protein CpaB